MNNEDHNHYNKALDSIPHTKVLTFNAGNMALQVKPGSGLKVTCTFTCKAISISHAESEFEFESHKQRSAKSALEITLGPLKVHQNTPKEYVRTPLKSTSEHLCDRLTY